jgi:hypothetical protein
MFRKIVYLLIILTLSLYATDLFIYPGFLENKIGIEVDYAFIPSIIGLIFYRFILKKTFPEKFLQIGILLIPAMISVFTLIQIIHPVVHPNLFFSTLHLHPFQLEIISLYLSLISLFLFDISFIRKSKKIVLLVAPFWILSLAVYFKWHFPFLFWFIEKEDSVTEYLTFGVYLAVAFAAYKMMKRIMKYKPLPKVWRMFLFAIFAVITFTAAVIAGEEISWGQRIFGFRTPDAIAENNTQYEFNLHNQKSVFSYVYIAYAILGIYGSSSWAIIEGFKKAKMPKAILQTLEMLSPPLVLIGFFIPIVVYAILRQNLGDVRFDQWEELVELYLAAGIFLFLYSKFNLIKQSRTKE